MSDSSYEIHFHHIGGFAGSLPLNIPSRLKADVCLYLYDADAKAMEALVPETDFRQQKVFGQAVFDHDGEVDVHLNYHPAASSLFPLNPDFLAYWRDGNHQSDMCDIRTNDQREVSVGRTSCTTIDALREAYGFGVDILSMDAEGSEKYILDGARGALATSVVGLITEVHFQEVRRGQTSAGDLFARINAAGFHMAEMQMHGGRAYRRMPLGWRVGGCSTSGDAFFMKRMDRIRESYPAPAVALLKLAFFALATNQLEHAIAATDAAVAIDGDVLRRGDPFAYIRLLASLIELHRAEEPLFLPTWEDFYPTAEAGMRHGDAGRGVDPADACRRYFSRIAPVKFMERLVALAGQDDSRVEKLLRENEFSHLANLVKQQRLHGVTVLLRWLGLMENDQAPSVASIGQKIMTYLSASPASVATAAARR